MQLGPGAPLTVRCWCVVRERWFEEPGWKVVQRSFFIAGQTGELARPLHLLVAISELDSPVGSLLASVGEPLYERAPDPPAVKGGSGSYLLSQTQQAARQWAAGEPLRPEHLLVAAIDQANPEALAACPRRTRGGDSPLSRSRPYGGVDGPAGVGDTAAHAGRDRRPTAARCRGTRSSGLAGAHLASGAPAFVPAASS